MDKIDADAMTQDLRRQFAAIYKSAIETPIMPDDPFVELLAKSEELHMQLYIDGLCEYIDSRPTIDAAPVRRGEWVDNEDDVYWHNSFIRKHCSACGAEPHKNRDDAGRIVGYILSHHCPHCGADMRKEEHHGLED